MATRQQKCRNTISTEMFTCLIFLLQRLETCNANKLNLVRYNVLGTKEADYDLHIDAETASPPKACLACCSENIVGGGRQEILIKDTPMYGKRVGIYVKARRIRCLECGKTLTERLPDVAEGQRMTTRLYRWIAARSRVPLKSLQGTVWPVPLVLACSGASFFLCLVSTSQGSPELSSVFSSPVRRVAASMRWPGMPPFSRPMMRPPW
jgi:zinc-finger of transposase IS204/IS1001/IS1096/IS1165